MSVANKLKAIFSVAEWRFAKSFPIFMIMGINTVVLRSGWQKRFLHIPYCCQFRYLSF
ncbi:hypothetical protein [Providencia hangzhouensis]|uniref:hypothetical protein n=1 Tax=Providencia hangzhouensis TaxID=3031799 RepID=UPI0034DD9A4C